MAPPNAPGVPGMRLPPPAREEPRQREPTRRGMPAPERETRPQPTNPPPAESMPPPPSFRHEDGPPNARPRAAPAREKLDSVEVATGTLLDELAAKVAEVRAAEERAHEAELRAAAAESGTNAQGPSFSLGSARWWVLVLGALAVGGPLSASQVREWLRPSISAEQLDALRKQVQSIADGIEKRNVAADAKESADGKRWTILLAFQCSQGLRARGLDCDEAQRYADFQPVPLTGPNKVRGAPQWKSGANWPPVPAPKE